METIDLYLLRFQNTSFASSTFTIAASMLVNSWYISGYTLWFLHDIDFIQYKLLPAVLPACLSVIVVKSRSISFLKIETISMPNLLKSVQLFCRESLTDRLVNIEVWITYCIIIGIQKLKEISNLFQTIILFKRLTMCIYNYLYEIHGWWA